MRYKTGIAELIGRPAEGVVEHIVSVFGNVDDGGDVIFPGAFKKTLTESGPSGADRIRATWQHDIWEPIGRPLEMAEVGRDALTPAILKRAPNANGGLRVVTKISMTTRGRDALTLMEDGVLNEWSIGYYPVKWGWDESGEKPIRSLNEVKLIEYALVTLAMNQGALTTGMKATVKYQNLPMAGEDIPWDAAEAEKRVRKWAGGEDDTGAMDWESYRSAFVIFDEDDPERLSSYKLQIADVIDGKLTAVPRGVFAAAVAVQGGRSPLVEFEEGDTAGAKTHLARYYDRLDRTAPWDREKRATVETLVESILSRGTPLKSLNLHEFSRELILMQSPGAQDVWSDQVGLFAAAWTDNAVAMKAGRVLSAANAAKVDSAITQMREAISALEALMAAAKPPEKEALTLSREILTRRINLQLAELNYYQEVI